MELQIFEMAKKLIRSQEDKKLVASGSPINANERKYLEKLRDHKT